MTKRSKEDIIRRLTWIVEHHVPRQPDDRGRTCDEQGCSICNGGADNPQEEAEFWFDAWEHPDIDPDYGPMPSAHLPFDPYDDEDWAEWEADVAAEAADA